MAGLPISKEFVTAAIPWVFNGICARNLGPFQKEARPVGLTLFEGLAATVAVKITEFDPVGPRDDSRVVVVALA